MLATQDSWSFSVKTRNSQVPGRPSRRLHRVANIDGEVVDGRCLPWKVQHLRLVQNRLRDVGQTHKDKLVPDMKKTKVECHLPGVGKAM
jgi:hypothetical protein